jgi:hypothetical protein
MLLSTTLKPSTKPPAPDKACKVQDTQTVCLATFKHFERSTKGWMLYLEGNSPYVVSSMKLPRNQIGKTLEVVLEPTPVGWTVTDFSIKY